MHQNPAPSKPKPSTSLLASGIPLPQWASQAHVAGAFPSGTAQRVQIWEDFNTFLGGAMATQALIDAYVARYEVVHMDGLAQQYGTVANQIALLTTARTQYNTAYAASLAGPANWPRVGDDLKDWVKRINAIIKGKKNIPSQYSAADAGNWADVGTAVGAAHGAVNAAAAGVAPESHDGNARNIQTINYSATAGVFPQTLIRLLRDIHGAWKSGQTLDERTSAEKQGRTLNSNHPGGLRSWHMNTSQTLPAAAGGATPARNRAMEQHYTNTSGVMHALGVAAPAGPIGFAEYTGTGILNDAHNSKIILDYKRGDVYLTLTHYQHWSNGGAAGFQVRGQAPSAAGTHSPWFKIDMNA